MTDIEGETTVRIEFYPMMNDGIYTIKIRSGDSENYVVIGSMEVIANTQMIIEYYEQELDNYQEYNDEWIRDYQREFDAFVLKIDNYRLACILFVLAIIYLVLTNISNKSIILLKYKIWKDNRLIGHLKVNLEYSKTWLGKAYWGGSILNARRRISKNVKLVEKKEYGDEKNE